ncbi:MAG: hypothetical protein KIT85_00230 [Pseudolabrys sp.]|nr:hypothetical protein [Pseudolabrys sp.]MCW5682787.1 hypothetical protein [Pseudolabrys sp.]
MSVAIQYCGLDQAGQLMAFFRDHWARNHILGNSKELLDWQHRDESKRRYNFLIAVSASEIVGMLGFIPTNRYDSSLLNSGFWLTTWKVRADFAHGLGVSLLRSLALMEPHTWIGTVGLNPSTRGIYELLGYKTGVLSRYFLLNDELGSFRLAAAPDGFSHQRPDSGGTKFSVIEPNNFIEIVDSLALEPSISIPAKSPRYLYQRYLQNPFYKYEALLAEDEDGASAILVIRRCEHAGAYAIRIVDFMGAPKAIAGAGDAFRRLLRNSGAEYLDFYCTNLDAELSMAGLSRQEEVSGLILPSHFEPFEKRNVELTYALKGSVGRAIVCKGDADQDRPNSLPLNCQLE